MKKKLTEEFKEILTNGKRWALLEVEYAKLTAAEKLTMLMSALALGAIMLMASVIILALLLLALAEVFKLMVDPWLAYICTAGVGAIIAGIIYLLRKTLILNPIARLFTRILLGAPKSSSQSQNK